MDDKELLALLKQAEAICRPDSDGVFSEVVNAFGRLMGERDKAIKERDAAVKCAQRFSYCNERKCRWCRFGFLDEDKEWDCAHPLKDAPCKGNPFAYPCRRFEYVYREENDRVLGWLTADDVFGRIKAHWEARNDDGLQ